MPEQSLLFTIFLIFAGAAVLATLALFARQALLVAYIVLGMLFGPWALGLVSDAELVRQIADIGIVFLLFLLGLNLPVAKLIRLVGETTLVTAGSSLVFGGTGYLVGWLFGFNNVESLLIGAALMFSSTIIGLKLLPTTMLHHQRTGEIIISILLLQDLVAIGILLALEFQGGGGLHWREMALLAISLPSLFALSFLLERYVFVKLIERFDTIQEYIFLMAIAWCLGFAELAAVLGLSHETGAFIGGVALANNRISWFIADSLKPLRDFFLIIFFFSLGAGFDLRVLPEIFMPALLLAALTLGLKPLVFKYLLVYSGETHARAGEIGMRMGQISEFSLLIAVLALDLAVIGARTSYLIQAATILTFLVSTYLVVLKYPTPIAVSDRLRRD